MFDVLFLLAASIVPDGESFKCTPVAVWDGDGPIWCAEGPHVRIADLAARELDNTCRRGHPCPKASGIRARDALVKLLGGPRGKLRTGHIRVSAPAMQCLSRGWGEGTRTAASCSLSDGRDLADAMIATKTTLRWNYRR